MPRKTDPNSRTTPVTVKVTREEAHWLRALSKKTAGLGLRRLIDMYYRRQT